MKELLDIKKYIESGILEEYALGLTSQEQNIEILENLKKYPELSKELSQIEDSLEAYSNLYAKPISPDLKSKILENIFSEKNNIPTQNFWKNKFPYLFFITSFAVLCIWLYNLNRNLRNQLNQSIKRNSELIRQANQDSLAILDCNNQLNYFKNSNLQRIILKGMPKSPESIAMVYYDSVSQKSILDIISLPKPSPEKQYQLWAIVSGKPVDLGVLDLNEKTRMMEIKFVDKPQAFAITLEPKGGLPAPTMDQLFVLGQI
ncbi:MAG: anti-sigma factor [Saprospiraceae bacterium]|nr:anti-sigma factor [Candidatus Vicinibacter proximus]MBL7822215.1 anti-sigma factor [Saprospiraceae bacterium]MCC6843265.1 anti-sigma factor [Saprospiraceae bacterium]HRG33046.1 anti-sigma factor [Saprospiraceae bacterium]